METLRILIGSLYGIPMILIWSSLVVITSFSTLLMRICWWILHAWLSHYIASYFQRCWWCWEINCLSFWRFTVHQEWHTYEPIQNVSSLPIGRSVHSGLLLHCQLAYWPPFLWHPLVLMTSHSNPGACLLSNIGDFSDSNHGICPCTRQRTHEAAEAWILNADGPVSAIKHSI